MKTDTASEGARSGGSPECCTLFERPDLDRAIDEVSHAVWPEFLLHGDVTRWRALFSEFAGWQSLILGPSGNIIAVGHAVPLDWKGTVEDLPPSIDALINRALEVRRAGARPTALAALAVMVVPEARGRGLSVRLIRAILRLAAQNDLPSLIAPVRPIHKDRYARVPMEQYLDWKRTDGAPFDPWVRVHWRLGAKRLTVAESTLVVERPVEDWVRWVGRRFPRSGGYVIPGALQPVQIDLERGIGRYEDPNVWMCHDTGEID